MLSLRYKKQNVFQAFPNTRDCCENPDPTKTNVIAVSSGRTPLTAWQRCATGEFRAQSLAHLPSVSLFRSVYLRSRQPCGSAHNHSGVVRLVLSAFGYWIGFHSQHGQGFLFSPLVSIQPPIIELLSEEEANNYLAREEISRLLPNPKLHYLVHNIPTALSHRTLALSVFLTNNSLF
jgi:hypothetical protein